MRPVKVLRVPAITFFKTSDSNFIFSRNGFIALYSFVLLLILGIFGIAYWWVSRLTTDMILKEAHRIKARNFAQAGVEKVLINILNQYRMSNSNLEYPSKYIKERIDQEYNKEFGDGLYRVESVKPYKTPDGFKHLTAVPYYKNHLLIGYYDVWDITVVGEIPDTGIKAKVHTLVKVIRPFAQY